MRDVVVALSLFVPGTVRHSQVVAFMLVRCKANGALMQVCTWRMEPLTLSDLAFVKLAGVYKGDMRWARPIPSNLERHVAACGLQFDAAAGTCLCSTTRRLRSSGPCTAASTWTGSSRHRKWFV